MYLLDTNHLSAILKNDEIASKNLNSSGFSYFSCVIVKGEMIFMASNSEFKERNFKLQSTGISDNNLWIASIAKEHDLIVLSKDVDFKKISEVSNIKIASWF